MKKISLSILLLCFFAIFWLFPNSASAAKYGKVTVDSIPLYETHEETRRGYAGYLFQVKNNDNKPHVVQVRVPKESHVSGTSSLESNVRAIKLAPGQRSHLWLYQPAINMLGYGAALVTVDGYAYKDRLLSVDAEHGALASDGTGFAIHRTPPHTGGNQPPEEKEEEISTEEIAEPVEKGAEEEAPPEVSFSDGGMGMGGMPGGGMGMGGMGMPGGGMGMTAYQHSDSTIAILASRGLSGNLRDQLKKLLGNSNVVRSAQKTSAWPTNWIAYSQFDGIILTDGEFALLPPEVVNALTDYASVGGVVWVRPEKDAKTKTSAPLEELRHAADAGLGVLLTGKRDGRPFRKEAIERIKCTNQWHEPVTAAKALPAIERDAMPVRLFLVLLIFYAMLIGPALQVVLKIKRRRIWMLWIIPVASLVLCVAVFIGSYLAEGFDGYANFRNITLLDQKDGRASTVGWASFYSPLADSAGLKFSTATVLQPQWQSQGWGSVSFDQHLVAINWSSGQHLTSGWLMAKTPISFRLWKAEARREKLTIRKDEQGNLTATNALGADADGLKLCTPDGTWYTAEKILAGKTATLNKTSAPAQESFPDVKDFCLNASNWTIPNADKADSQRVKLTPGSYQVMLDGHPFVNTAITDPARDQGKTLVIGQFELE